MQKIYACYAIVVFSFFLTSVYGFGIQSVKDSASTGASSECVSLIGNWSGISSFYSFSANASTLMGNQPDVWRQENVLTIEEQLECFVRGRQWYYEPETRVLFFVSSVFGVVETLDRNYREIIRIRLQEYYNDENISTDETLGILDIQLGVKDLDTMYITYTGISSVQKRYGAQTYVARRLISKL